MTLPRISRKMVKRRLNRCLHAAAWSRVSCCIVSASASVMRWWRVTLHPRRGCPLLLPGQGTNRCASRRGERGHQRGWRPRLPAWLATRASTRALIGSRWWPVSRWHAGADSRWSVAGSSRNSSRRSRAPTSWIPTARPTRCTLSYTLVFGRLCLRPAPRSALYLSCCC